MEERRVLFCSLLVFVFLGIVSASSNFPFSLRYDEPAYAILPSQSEPSLFFSGQPFRIEGDFLGKEIVIRLFGNDIHKELMFEISFNALTVELPFDIPTGSYTLVLVVDGWEYQTSFNVYGYEERGGGGAAEEAVELSDALLYHSFLECGNCYWELSFVGHPSNPDHLFLVGKSRSQPRISYDGGRTWENAVLEGVHWRGDPKTLVTEEGRLFVSGLSAVVHPSDPQKYVTAGSFFQGEIIGNSFSGVAFHAPLENLPLDEDLVVDFPKLAYGRGKVFILGNDVFFDEGREGIGFFISEDGSHFQEYYLYKGTAPYSADTTLDGKLRAVTVKLVGDDGDIFNPFKDPSFACRWDLLKVEEDADFTFVDGPSARCGFRARVSADDTARSWAIIRDVVELAIDKSSRHPGRIYIVWTEPVSYTKGNIPGTIAYFGNDFNVFFSYSDDDGESWSDPVKVSDDTNGGDQVFPSAKVDSEGVLHVAFLDRREHPELPQFDVYYVKVVDGKVSQNIRVNPISVPNSVGGREPGDYLDMIMPYPDKVYIAYPCKGNQERQPWLPPQEKPADACLAALDPRMIPVEGDFIRGNSNGDDIVDMSDAIFYLRWLFQDGIAPECLDAADVNDDGTIDVSDPVALLSYLFQNGRSPSKPYPYFGSDLTEDGLGCQALK